MINFLAFILLVEMLALPTLALVIIDSL